MENYHLSVRCCSNCLHYIQDGEKVGQCCINYSKKPSACRAFTPKDADVEQQYAKEVMDKDSSFPMVFSLCTTLFAALALLFYLAFGESGKYIGKVLALACVVGGSITGVLYAILHLRRERMKRDIAQKLSLRLTIDYIEEVLAANNLKPECMPIYGFLTFTSNGQEFLIKYDGTDLLLLHRTGHEKVDAASLQALAIEIENEIRSIKVLVIQDDNETFIDSFYVACISTRSEFDRHFWESLYYLEWAAYSVTKGLLKILPPESPEAETANTSRQDVYLFEYRFMPLLVSAVCKGEMPIEVLTDEEWIHSNIQTHCTDAACKEALANFKIKRVDTYGDYKLIVYQFPEPMVVPEAKYAAVMINSATRKADYYTLETSHNGEWFYGGMAEERHLNYGVAGSADLGRFIEWVLGSGKNVEISTDCKKQ